MCCGQGGDNSKFHISLIHKHSDSYGYTDVLWTRGRLLLIPYITHTQHSDSYGYIDGQGGTTLNSIYHSYTTFRQLWIY